MYEKAPKLALDYDVISAKQEEILHRNGKLLYSDIISIIENEVLTAENVHYTDRFIDGSHVIDEEKSEAVFILRYHDQNKYPHDFFGKPYTLEDDGGIASTQKTVDRIMLYHFKNGRADVYLFPLHPPKCLPNGEIMYDQWTSWDRKIRVDGSCIVYTLTADFWDCADYNDHTNFRKSTGFRYDFVKQELEYHV